jgi:hypothetical protein
MQCVVRKNKTIKHSEGVVAKVHLNPNLSQWKEGNHDYYLWLWVNSGIAFDLFVCVVYVAPVGSKHESESLFQNLVVDITQVQTLRGIILLGGDFNARITTLLNTIDISDLCELLQALELVETEQPSVVAKRQNHNVNVGGWGCELLDLCCNAGLLILNGRTPGDKSREFICLANGGLTLLIILVVQL